jgi:hypothetical protein
VTGFAFAEYQNAMLSAALVVDWANGLKQCVTVSGATSSSYNIGFVGGDTGQVGTLRIAYNVNQAPGITGCRWPNSVRPLLTGSTTGGQDLIAVYFNGAYYAQAALAFGVA